MLVTPRYGEALGWAFALHKNQRRDGKDVPFVAHLLAVSSLVWEDGGNEDQAIAALLHDAIEDASQTHGSIASRFGDAVADIVRDCTDPAKVHGSPCPAPWLEAKRSFIASLEQMPAASLLVTAAEKAHNARDHVLDGRRDPSSWQRASAGLEASTWYYRELHQQLSRQLPGSRSVELLGTAVCDLLALPDFCRLVPAGIDPIEWAASYLQRQQIPNC
ncbi:HD domain-containing protein [Synechococcus sp. CS-1326]|uniref:HD domain-containing protein n=1 Tax=Synechococcus sp. CS-1326 TaxID=2847978 RepID=UPI00223BD6FF|nr:HD domain-containing protein [Synechococcus sp. CS-1326]MCT0213109.1 HD domain-containing protein [Synechococcus sp. CS-1326]